MDSPQSGFRRAAATSWALAGIGMAGVAATSALAYADTFKPQATEAPIVVVEPAPPDELGPAPVLDARQPPVPGAPPNDPPPLVTPQTIIEQHPVTQETQAPEYTPRQTYQPVPAPVTHQSKAPSAPPTTRRRDLTPTTVIAPNYSPRITISHGS
jgi:protein TonB